MAALSILTVKFVAIGLSKELAGNYNSAYGFLQLFGILADFGLYAVALREISRSELNRERVLGALIVIRSIILVFSLLLALGLVWLLPQWRGTPLPLGVTIAALVPFFTLLAGIIRTVFQVHYKMQYVFIAEVAQRIFTASFIGMFIVAGIRGSHDLHIYHMFLFIGGVGAFLLFFFSLVTGNRLMKIRPCLDTVMIKQLLKKAAPYGLAFLCVALYRQFDVTMIALLRPDFELQNAYYGFVVRMTDMGYLLPTFLLNSTLPVLSERNEKGEDTKDFLGKTLLALLMIGSIAALFSSIWSRQLVQLLTTNMYLSTVTHAGSDTALRLLSLPLFLNALVLYGFYVLLTKHKWQRLVTILCIGAVISVSLNIVLIPIHGFVGAGTTSIIVHIILAALLFPQAQKVMPAHIPINHIFRWLAFSALLAIELFAVRTFLSNEIFTVLGLAGMTIAMIATGFACRIHTAFRVIGK